MKKLLISAFMAIVACLMTACSSNNSPSAAAEQYANYIMKSDYKSAINMIHFKGTPEEVQGQRDYYLQIIESKVEDGLPDDKKMTKYEVTKEEVDEENGKATVTANVTYANGKTKEETTKLVKTDDGWFVDGEK